MKLFLYGARGHGKVVAEIIAALGIHELVGFVDDDPSKTGQSIGNLPVLGTADVLPDLKRQAVTAVIVTIGKNDVRMTKAAALRKMGFELVTAIHPAAVVAPDVRVGDGTVVMAGSVINPGVKIGQSVIINTGATVDHDCVLADGVHLSPGVHLAGNVQVGNEAHVGIGSSVIQNIVIGEKSIVGAGAVVIRDVPSGKTVVGNPARELPHAARG